MRAQNTAETITEIADLNVALQAFDGPAFWRQLDRENADDLEVRGLEPLTLSMPWKCSSQLS
jgi:hypothetical protein